MLRKSVLGVAMLAVVSVSSAAVAAPVPTTGVIRNQVALGVAGRPTPYMRAVASRTAGSQNLAGQFGGAGLFVFIGAFIAALAGLYFGLHHRHGHHGNPSNPGNPVSS